VVHFVPGVRQGDESHGVSERGDESPEEDAHVAGEINRRLKRRLFPSLLTITIMVGMGLGVAYAWHAYKAQALTAAEGQAEAVSAQPGASPSINELQDLKTTISRLTADQQNMAETIAVLQNELREAQQAMTQRQAEIQRLSDSVGQLVSKPDAARKPAPKPTASVPRGQNSGARNHDAAGAPARTQRAGGAASHDPNSPVALQPDDGGGASAPAR
jgi:hypothetical protein